MKLRFPTAFSVDFSKSVETESYFFGFFIKKLPLEALGSSAFSGMQSGPFYQNGRLGPPESERVLGMRRLFSEKAEIPSQKQ